MIVDEALRAALRDVIKEYLAAEYTALLHLTEALDNAMNDAHDDMLEALSTARWDVEQEIGEGWDAWRNSR